jgi:hypothetical protein
MNTDRYPFGALSQGTTLLADAITLHARFPVRNEVSASALPSRTTATSGKRAPRERKGWLDRLDDWFSRQRQNAREAYLAQARDVFEVERRIRDLERNIGSRYY